VTRVASGRGARSKSAQRRKGGGKLGFWRARAWTRLMARPRATSFLKTTPCAPRQANTRGCCSELLSVQRFIRVSNCVPSWVQQGVRSRTRVGWRLRHGTRPREALAGAPVPGDAKGARRCFGLQRKRGGVSGSSGCSRVQYRRSTAYSHLSVKKWKSAATCDAPCFDVLRDTMHTSCSEPCHELATTSLQRAVARNFASLGLETARAWSAQESRFVGIATGVG